MLTDGVLDGTPAAAVSQRYYPETSNGPLKLVDNEWYYNGATTLEIMFHRDLQLSDCIRVEIVPHRRDLCRLHGSNCPDRNRSKGQNGCKLLAYILGTKNKRLCKAFTTDIDPPNNWRYHNDLMYPFIGLSNSLLNVDNYKGAVSSKKEARDVLIAACLLLASDQEDRANDLVSLLPSEAFTKLSLERIVQDQFGLAGVPLYI